MTVRKITSIFVISDSIGETAETVAKAAISQFDLDVSEIQRIPYVNTLEVLEQVIQEATKQPSLIIYTLVIPELRIKLQEKAALYNIPTIDILGPVLNMISEYSGQSPKMQPGLIHRLDEHYFRKVEAIEFAVKYDDGKDPRGLIYADIVLIGVSRTSKTPLSMYLAYKRIKAANVPLLPEVVPPKELFTISAQKVVGLTIRPELLNAIRQERLKTLGLDSNADYAKLDRINRELEYARRIIERIGCPVIDVSNKAIEETASRILQIIYQNQRDNIAGK